MGQSAGERRPSTTRKKQNRRREGRRFGVRSTQELDYISIRQLTRIVAELRLSRLISFTQTCCAIFLE
ncbi:hypothetical protein MPL1032_270147 [Mesorhizobium plurifarium]|uniref:Uncharacterized protein n=1 Tax=Mesorhizobium plurifarium TaxID=69974 RepID=A0A0K2W252_MESPL|nr:hypothetical protein MPL1032_270147 [Mesorhizobium plurifarium]